MVSMHARRDERPSLTLYLPESRRNDVELTIGEALKLAGAILELTSALASKNGRLAADGSTF